MTDDTSVFFSCLVCDDSGDGCTRGDIHYVDQYIVTAGAAGRLSVLKLELERHDCSQSYQLTLDLDRAGHALVTKASDSGPVPDWAREALGRHDLFRPGP